ncbi:two-component system, OmpR family, sensor histidine kinase BaeS [Alkalispirochaeta americana]|uniref:histidine kinase n=1 Tax=Alkalispirochaeta americana TaxID=159291 RepID=A0A1N6UDM9_9SPIO|nr:HAMP domain-containing sensor histidine kinase [Alkalispirochaeta americana]SIQ63406.1 two-component system, OmpR family, sensor histidine kinase BaeS [Alkalispirochaeta americana]
MKTLFGRTFLGMAGALLLLSIVLGVIFMMGLRRSVTLWNVNKTRHLQSTFSREILRVVRAEGTLQEERLSPALGRFLTPGVSLVILDPQREPVFVYHQGARIDPEDTRNLDPLLSTLGKTRNPALAVFDQEHLVAYLSVDTLGFRSDLSNRQFINSLVLTVAVALLLSLALALVGAGLISRHLTAQASRLATGLGDLASGSRHVSFPREGAQELRAIADAARALQDQLTQAEQLRRQWMQDISHDLRTPVSALASQLEGMIEGVLAPAPERLRSLFSEVHRVEELVRALRELSWVESPELSLEEEPVRLDQLVNTATERIAHRRERNDLSNTPEGDTPRHDLWTLDIPPALCRGDRNLLLRALTNLLENALIHGDPHRPVTARITETPREVHLWVENKGWIPEKDREHLFDRLYRGDRSRSSPGSGLGLAITRAIVDRHQGRITISQQEETVVAHLVLPRATPPEAGSSPPEFPQDH